VVNLTGTRCAALIGGKGTRRNGQGETVVAFVEKDSKRQTKKFGSKNDVIGNIVTAHVKQLWLQATGRRNDREGLLRP